MQSLTHNGPFAINRILKFIIQYSIILFVGVERSVLAFIDIIEGQELKGVVYSRCESEL